jgi:hypothetical protein
VHQAQGDPRRFCSRQNGLAEELTPCQPEGFPAFPRGYSQVAVVPWLVKVVTPHVERRCGAEYGLGSGLGCDSPSGSLMSLMLVFAASVRALVTTVLIWPYGRPPCVDGGPTVARFRSCRRPTHDE